MKSGNAIAAQRCAIRENSCNSWTKETRNIKPTFGGICHAADIDQLTIGKGAVQDWAAFF